MSKYQVFKNAIEAFQPDGADLPILYSSTEINERSLKVLSGRKLKLRSFRMTILLFVYVFIIIAGTIVSAILTREWGGSLIPFFPSFFLLWLIISVLARPTLITIGNEGLNFYFLEVTFGKYVVSDKTSLPYAKISDVTVKVGKVFKHTNFTVHFNDNGKSHKIKFSVSNEMRKVQEQSENLKILIETLDQTTT
ncbi:MAG: hypothetical protein FWE05_13445 [Defluviitaleaceae bacterium]|nr:hypothetical protein [Defluviitaleaceae bacterium]